MQYADDTIILMDENKEMADNRKVVVLWFGAILGLAMNEKKVQNHTSREYNVLRSDQTLVEM